MQISVDKIQVTNRIRKDFGNINELAQSIKERGLLQPIIVTPDNILIAGERRLRAVKQLGLLQIEAIVKTASDREEQLLCEIAENEKRKDFTPSERVTYGLELEQIARLKAKENQGKRNDLTSESIDYEDKKTKRTDIVVGEKVGLSGPTYRRAKRVIESGNKDLIQQMDEGKIGIFTAYEKLKPKKEDKPVEKAPNKPKEEIDFTVPTLDENETAEILPHSEIVQELQMLVNQFMSKAARFQFMDERIKTLSRPEKEQLRSDMTLVKNWANNFETLLNKIEEEIK